MREARKFLKKTETTSIFILKNQQETVKISETHLRGVKEFKTHTRHIEDKISPEKLRITYLCKWKNVRKNRVVKRYLKHQNCFELISLPTQSC